MAQILDWPSVADPNDAEEFCPYCESMPDERHHPRCPMRGPDVYADEIEFCDECGSSFVTACPCSGEDDY